jgi:hypothetical protein
MFKNGRVGCFMYRLHSPAFLAVFYFGWNKVSSKYAHINTPKHNDVSVMQRLLYKRALLDEQRLLPGGLRHRV